jgi:dTDP-glucose 4,6-dehydratase
MIETAGLRAAETFEKVLRKTVQCYLACRAWWQAILHRGYKAKRIGLSWARPYRGTPD